MLYDWLKTLFDSPSRRSGIDYSKEISIQAKAAVLLLYRDYIADEGPSERIEVWIGRVIRDLGHLHHSFAGHFGRADLGAIGEFLNEEPSPEAFLDFLEVSLRDPRAPNDDNDFVDAINVALEHHDSPYLLTQYVRRKVPDGQWFRIVFDAFPRAYLRHDTIIQREGIKPTLEFFADTAFKSPSENFQKALSRHRSGDYDGCVTACAAAVEGTIKVVAAKNWWKVKGNSLETLAQSFIAKSSLPATLRTLFRPLADWRNVSADAHGYASKDVTTEAIARNFIAITASLVVLIQSEIK